MTMRAGLLSLAWLLAGLPAWAASLTLSVTIGGGDGVETPGPNAASFASPPYQCTTNVYVSPNGSDSAAGTISAPWNTMKRANASVAPGTCVNVQPGIYAAGVTLTRGGNAATPTGYVVYRCTVMLACKITANGGYGAPAFAIAATGTVNYVMVDGFDIAASAQIPYGVGVIVSNNSAGPPTGTLSAHHIWITNNRIHGFGEAGIGINEADWVFVLHNEVYGNAGVTCDAQGSGIGLVVAKALSNYTPTSMDARWSPFNQIVAWNVSHDNALTACGTASNPYDTDGNGIILDTFNGSGVDNVLYPKQTLVANNVVHDNGGKGIQVFRTSYATVANNTAYNNNLDPWNQGFPRGEITLAGVTNSALLNNIAISLPAASTSDARCKGATYGASPAPCPLMANVALLAGDGAGVTNAGNSFLNNLTFGGAPPWGWGPSGNAILNGDTAAFSCSANKCNVSPLLVNAPGNFALQSTSPAINYGQAKPWLPATAVDAGACPRSLPQCP